MFEIRKFEIRKAYFCGLPCI